MGTSFSIVFAERLRPATGPGTMRYLHVRVLLIYGSYFFDQTFSRLPPKTHATPIARETDPLLV